MAEGRFWAVVAMAAALGVCSTTGLAATQETQGVYTDGRGARHPWKIDSNDTLQWEGKAFVPVGGMFCFRFLSEFVPGDPPGNEARWKEDLEILERVRKAGIRHLYVNPVNRATQFPARAWNRCLEALERGGFQYGIELTDGPRHGMEGYVLGGSSWEASAQGDRLQLRFQAEFNQYPRLLELLAIPPSAAPARVSVPPTCAATVTIVMPDWARVPGTVFIPRIEAPAGFNVADLWDGFEEYELRLMTLLRGLSRGAGLRMLLDPFTNEMNFYGYTSQMVVTSGRFRSGFATWLSEKYRGRPARAWRAWGAAGPSPGWRVMARLLPVPGRPLLIDPETNRAWTVDAPRSVVLEDLRSYRDRSAGAQVTRLAARIRSGFADVPILLKHTGRLARFMTQCGIDGVGAEVWGGGMPELAHTLGPAFSVLRHRDRTGWLPVTETAPDPQPRGNPPGYATREAMFAHLDALLRLGGRGFYLFALRPVPEQLLPDFCLYRDPRQLEWMAAWTEALSHPPRSAQLVTRPGFRLRAAEAGPGLRVPGWRTGDAAPSPAVELQDGRMVLPWFGGADPTGAR